MIKIFKNNNNYLINSHAENKNICYSITNFLKDFEKISNFRLKLLDNFNTHLLQYTTEEEKQYVLNGLKKFSLLYPNYVKYLINDD